MASVKKPLYLLTLFLTFILVAEPAVGARNGGSLGNENKSNVSSAHDDLVTNLPGQPAVGFRHYAGYVTVNEKNGRALFYWFYEAEGSPEQKPLVLWLNGGPGCSSVGYGATQEIGPFLIDAPDRIKFNPYSWNREANLLFLESPVGVGFSYTNTTSDYKHLGDELTANDTYTFLHKWFEKFPAYRTRAFYIAGESYAGKYVPVLAELILERNTDPSLHINLTGILLGNPETENGDDWEGMVDYAWSHAVISEETYRTIKASCDFYSNDTWSNKTCGPSVDEMFKQYKEIDRYSLNTPICHPDAKTPDFVFKRSSTMVPRILAGFDPCIDRHTTAFYLRPDVQKALHVSNGHQLKNWSLCNHDIYHNWTYQAPSVLPIYKKLIAAGLKIWVYSGDMDGRVPVLSTRYSLRRLGLPIVRAWAPWYHEREVSGWFQEYKGLTFATFRGAGHAVPTFKPSNSFAFFSAYILGQDLPTQR